jgi:hypothetical protein
VSHEQQKNAVARAGALDELRRLSRDFSKASAARVDGQRSLSDQVRAAVGDAGQADVRQ